MVDKTNIPSTIEEVTSSLEAESSIELSSNPWIELGLPLDVDREGTPFHEKADCSVDEAYSQLLQENEYQAILLSRGETNYKLLLNQVERLRKELAVTKLALQAYENSKTRNAEKQGKSRFSVHKVDEGPPPFAQQKKSVMARLRKLSKVTQAYFTIN